MKSTRSQPIRRRGATLVLIAILLPILFIFAGFAVDVANMQRTRSELRVATDLAAKAAAETLSRTGSTAQAVTAGKSIATANLVAGDGLTLNTSDFEFGRSEETNSGKWDFVLAANNQNSVRVSGNRTQSAPDGPVGLFFGSLIGQSSFEPTVQAAAAFLNVDICLVLDRSSSMKLDLTEAGGLSHEDSRFCNPADSNARWQDLDAAVRVFINELNSSNGIENLAMVTFGGGMDGSEPDCSGNADHSVVSVDMNLTTNLSNIVGALNSRTSSIWNGNTDIAKGIEEGINVLLNARPGADRVMILLTDGQYTEDNPVPWSNTAAANDITIHTITFGNLPSGPGETWITDMQTISANTGGKHLHAPNPTDLTNAFKDLASSLTVLIQ